MHTYTIISAYKHTRVDEYSPTYSSLHIYMNANVYTLLYLYI